jgi:thiamine-monophosphate kinase
MSTKANTLFDLGERRILREIIPRFVTGAGDDCASVCLGSTQLVITTDPVPRPAAQVIGHDDDPYWVGWLLVTINASDIAASGARPEGFVAALDLPRDFPVPQFERLLEGIRDSCHANGLRYIGGNIREGKDVAAVGTAFGSCSQAPLTRRGAKPGDHVVVLGVGGRFWSDAFMVRAGARVDKRNSPLFSPIAQANIVHHLNEAHLIHCAMDTSDGLAPTLEELALVNNLSIHVDLTLIRAASDLPAGVSRPERFWFGWGDWTVIAAVSQQALEHLAERAKDLGASWSVIGHFHEGEPELRLFDGDRSIRAHRLESERFAPDSWFLVGIEEYIRRLQAFPLP